LSVVRLIGIGAVRDAERVIGRQLLRAATSVAANYRSAGRARSRREFSSRIGVVLEEADESLFWLELLEELKYRPEMTEALRREARELVSIFSASYETARRHPRAPADPQITRSPD
jgi:four helix bundle protein